MGNGRSHGGIPAIDARIPPPWVLSYFSFSRKKRYGAVLLAPRRIFHHSREGGQLHCGWQCSRNGLDQYYRVPCTVTGPNGYSKRSVRSNFCHVVVPEVVACDNIHAVFPISSVFPQHIAHARPLSESRQRIGAVPVRCVQRLHVLSESERDEELPARAGTRSGERMTK